MQTRQVSISHDDQTEVRNLLIFSTGKILSIFGSAIYSFAIGLYVLRLTGSALSFAVTLILGTLPMILINPMAGVIADKFNKKVIVISMDFLNGILLISVYFICIKYELNLALIYITTFLLTVFTTFFGVGLEAAKPNLVTEKSLMKINSISKIIESVSAILGPICGGAVFALLDMKAFIMINGISFILSGLLMLLMEFNLTKHSSNNNGSSGKINFMNEIKDGFCYITERKPILNLFMLLISINFFLGFAVMVPMPYLITKVLKLDSTAFGLIEGAFFLGLITGALFVGKISMKYSLTTLLRYVSFFLSLLMILLGLPILFNLHLIPTIYTCYYCAVMAAVGIGIALIDLPFSYFMQKEIPDEYRGRVLSLGSSMGKIMLPVAMVSSGILLNHLPAYVNPIAGGGLFLLLQSRLFKKSTLVPVSEKVNFLRG